MEIIDIKISDEIFTESKQYEKITRKKHEGKFTKFDTKYDYFTGRLGELAFKIFLIKNLKLEENVDFVSWEFEENKVGIDDLYDKWDYKINTKTIDIKTERTKYEPDQNWCYGYPVVQKPNRKDYVIICLYNFKTNYIKFVGGMSGSKVSEYPPTYENCSGKFKYKILNYDIPQKDLIPTLKLVKNILRG